MAATIYDDGCNLANVSASSNFSLLGGEYAITVSATFGGGSVTWNVYSLNGTTAIPVMPAFTANGYGYLKLPAGNYQIAVATATAVYVSVSRVLQK